MNEPDVAALASVGVRIVRVNLDINTLEPTAKPGLYDSVYLAKLDQLANDCRQQSVCLDMAIKGDPALSDSNSQIAAPPDRLARLVGDLAARWPSVLYWEIGEDMNGGVSTKLEGVSPAAAGKTISSLLKALYPAAKAANSVAQVVCIARSDALLQAVYEDGAGKCFDVACGKTDTKGFTSNSVALRKVMTANGDESKPLWCVVEDGFDQEKLEPVFTANNNALLYAKVLVQKAKPGESLAWLKDARLNGDILAKPRSSVNVLVATEKPMLAVGYDSKEVEGGIQIQRVMLDSLVPTVIQLRYAPEPPPPATPSGKPAKPSKPKIDPRHVPDPWDI